MSAYDVGSGAGGGTLARRSLIEEAPRPEPRADHSPADTRLESL